MAAPIKKREIRQKLHDDEKDRVSSSSEDEEYEVADEQVRNNVYIAQHVISNELTTFSNTRSLSATDLFHQLLVF